MRVHCALGLCINYMELLMKKLESLFDGIVAAQLLEIEVSSFERGRLTVCAPLSKNSNDKGTFFAGSIYSAMVLSGWGLVGLLLADQGLDVDVVIATSGIDYVKPAVGDVEACALLKDGEGIEKAILSIESKGRGKVEVVSELVSDGVVCAVFTGVYVAMIRK